MSEEKAAPDLFDLKLLPAWVKETPNENRYADFAGEENSERPQRDRPPRDRPRGERRDRGPRPPKGKERRREGRPPDRRPGPERPRPPSREEERMAPIPPMEVRFVPAAHVLESVLAQIKAGHVAYSVFSLGRMFLDKPERYDVRLKAKEAQLFQLGENGPVASDQRVLENGAFVGQKDNFYRTDVTQSEPIKGNFTSVARCRLSGTLLGPTNHHAYQPQLRSLYEQRFSRRMSFPDYQRQIEIVSDPETVERWKEEARNVTTYVTLKEEPPLTFNSAAETERHFRQNYLPGLLRQSEEMAVDGVISRRLFDRSLGRLIEDAWAQEYRSPSKMMQELIGAFRQAGLHVFRHRKGMLFVSPVRVRPFGHGNETVSPNVVAILQALTANPGITRKQLWEKLTPAKASEGQADEPAEAGTEKPAEAPAPERPEGNEDEQKKLALASDLHWLISEGHVIEFNDGALDLARTKTPQPPAPTVAAADATSSSEPVVVDTPEVLSPAQSIPEATVAETPAGQSATEEISAPSMESSEVSAAKEEQPTQMARMLVEDISAPQQFPEPPVTEALVSQSDATEGILPLAQSSEVSLPVEQSPIQTEPTIVAEEKSAKPIANESFTEPMVEKSSAEPIAEESSEEPVAAESSTKPS